MVKWTMWSFLVLAVAALSRNRKKISLYNTLNIPFSKPRNSRQCHCIRYEFNVNQNVPTDLSDLDLCTIQFLRVCYQVKYMILILKTLVFHQVIRHFPVIEGQLDIRTRWNAFDWLQNVQWIIMEFIITINSITYSILIRRIVVSVAPTYLNNKMVEYNYSNGHDAAYIILT